MGHIRDRCACQPRRPHVPGPDAKRCCTEEPATSTTGASYASAALPPDEIEEEPHQPEQVAIPNMATSEIAPRPGPAATPPIQGKLRRINKRPDRLIEKC